MRACCKRSSYRFSSAAPPIKGKSDSCLAQICFFTFGNGVQLVNELNPNIIMLALQYLKSRCNLLWPNYQMINAYAQLVFLPLIASKVGIE